MTEKPELRTKISVSKATRRRLHLIAVKNDISQGAMIDKALDAYEQLEKLKAKAAKSNREILKA